MWGRKALRLIGYRNATMPLLAGAIYSYGTMAGEVDRPVVDQTGLNGRFDFTVEYAPGEYDRRRHPAPNPDAPPFDSQGAAFLTAVREQLGLKLVPSKGPIRMLVIDHVQRPSEN
jgi:bla regulator protein BlaR1